jgi:hypothetical protein
LRFGDGEHRLGLLDLGFVGARVDLKNQVALFYGRVVVDRQTHDVARDLWSNSRDVRIYLSVVGGDAARVDIPGDQGENDEHTDGEFRNGAERAEPVAKRIE